MSSSVRAESETPSVFSPLAEVTHDATQLPDQVRDALRRDQSELKREVLLWQRWIRYAAVGTLALVTLVFGPTDLPATLRLGSVTALYVGCVAVTGWLLQRSRGSDDLMREWVPGLMLTADIVVIGAFFYLSSPPQQIHRVLLLGIMSVQLAVFYFGRLQGTWAAVLTAVIYVVTSRIAPPFIPGPPPSVMWVTFNVTLFALVSGVFIFAYGGHRERMNRLRLFCKLVEQGSDMPGLVHLGDEKRPDDLTLLARSFEAMRVRLSEQIGSDPLTGCLNRRALETRLRTDWRYAKRRGSNVAVLAIDMDRFKEINDTFGHPVGDVVLIQIADIMRATARDTDAVARLGGDEFVILLPDTGWQGALTFAERLRRRVDDFHFGTNGHPIVVTLSIGVALARGTDPISPEMLLEEADRSLYKAKVGGRNRVFA